MADIHNPNTWWSAVRPRYDDDAMFAVKAGYLENEMGDLCGVWTERSHDMARQVVNFDDAIIREALIALGWTPPQ